LNEEDAGPVKDPQSVNQAARELYYKGSSGAGGASQQRRRRRTAETVCAGIKFRRGIGKYKDNHFSVTGEVSTRRLMRATYRRHCRDTDRGELRKITREADWIAAN
jgi:hypothetical protein